MADISSEAVKIAIDDLEQNLVQYGRDYEDAQRANDAVFGSQRAPNVQFSQRRTPKPDRRKSAAATRTVPSPRAIPEQSPLPRR